MSYALGLGAGRPRPAGIIALSGFIPTVAGFELDLAGRAGLPVAIGHGTLDPVIGVEFGRRARALLEDAGLAVRYQESPMPHSIDPAFLHELRGWRRGGRSGPLISLSTQLPSQGVRWGNDSPGGVALLTRTSWPSWRGFLRVHAALARELDAELDRGPRPAALVLRGAADGRRRSRRADADVRDRRLGAALPKRRHAARRPARARRPGRADPVRGRRPRPVRRAHRRAAARCSTPPGRRIWPACGAGSWGSSTPTSCAGWPAFWERLVPGATG